MIFVLMSEYNPVEAGYPLPQYLLAEIRTGVNDEAFSLYRDVNRTS